MAKQKNTNLVNDYIIYDRIKELLDQISGALSRLRNFERNLGADDAEKINKWFDRSVEIKDMNILDLDLPNPKSCNEYISGLVNELNSYLQLEKKYKKSLSSNEKICNLVYLPRVNYVPNKVVRISVSVKNKRSVFSAKNLKFLVHQGKTNNTFKKFNDRQFF